MLKLTKLSDRTPVKLTISISLNEGLAAYAAVYDAIYGSEEPIAEPVPAMLAGVLERHREFVRRSDLQGERMTDIRQAGVAGGCPFHHSGRVRRHDAIVAPADR